MHPESSLLHRASLPALPSAKLLERACKIVCTIGPCSQPEDCLRRMITSGMNVARMNFSHGTHDYHLQTVSNVRRVAQSLNKVVAVALDTKGPEIRTGLFPEGEIKMPLGHELYVTAAPEWRAKGSAECFYIDYPSLTSIMGPGDRIYIDDGLLGLDVLSVEGDKLRVRVSVPSTISSNKGCNLPGKNLDLPAVSVKDKEDLLWGKQTGVDMIFASFIRSADQVREVKSIVGPDILVISKIENQQGLDNIDEIISESDGIMIARGDLGVEIPAERVLLAQKMIMAKCNIAGKPVICATQMLDSMTKNPRPTRAEVSDVGNAVIDGADCVMLSGETAKGLFPETTIEVMARICSRAQEVIPYTSRMKELCEAQETVKSQADQVARQLAREAYESQAESIIIKTNSVALVQLISKYHPPCPIVVVTSERKVAVRLSIVRSVVVVIEDSASVDQKDLLGKVDHQSAGATVLVVEGDKEIKYASMKI